MNKTYVYHHNDDDGKCAAAIICQLEIQHNVLSSNIICIEVDYTTKLNFDKINIGDTVYFVDYSFSSESNINKLISIVRKGIKTIWLDHHKTSIDIEMDLPKDVRDSYYFIRVLDTKYCGSLICYAYGCANGIADNIELNTSYENSPNFIKYIDSYDTWKHCMPNTLEFNCGMAFKNNDIKEYFNEVFVGSGYSIFEPSNIDDNIFISNTIEKGTIAESYAKVINERDCNLLGYHCDIILNKRQYRCLVLNRKGGSQLFGKRINGVDIAISFSFNGEKFVYSLFSEDKSVDCSEIAKLLGKYTGLGGGGHRGAAGFQSNKLIFKKDCIIEIVPGVFKIKVNTIYLK